jgi:uncharacterized repeat protein (TIGR03803 family)
MKTSLKDFLLRPVLIAILGWILAGRVGAQTFTTLHSFTASSTNSSGAYTNSDGANPHTAFLLLSGNTLYGTATGGGSSGNGTVFAVNTNGTGFTNLHSFTATSGSNSTNSDGADPYGGLTLSGNTLYGTAASGGSAGNGTVFKVNTDGTRFTNLHSFTATSGSNSTNSDGAIPAATLIFSGDTLYGTAHTGGSSGNGTVFAVNTNGTGFTNLHNFTAGSGSFPNVTNSDGANPTAGLILWGNTLYGTTVGGSTNGRGTVFKVNTDGTDFTKLYGFTGGNDGANPFAGLIVSGNALYGTAERGGSSGNGTVFAVNTNGTGFTNLYSFAGGSDGAYPDASVILSGNSLYGNAAYGGSSGNGTVFAVNTNGTGFTNLYSFTAVSLNSSGYPTNSDGANPKPGLILSGNTLYGTATSGGSSGNGTVFSLSFPSPQLTIKRSGTNVNLTWPSGVAGYSYSGYTLQCTTNLLPTAWNPVSPAPVLVNTNYAVTNAISGTRKFYRLSQ